MNCLIVDFDALCVVARRNKEAIQSKIDLLDCFVPRSDAKRPKFGCKFKEIFIIYRIFVCLTINFPIFANENRISVFSLIQNSRNIQIFKTMRKISIIIASLSLLLAFAQCTKDKEKEHNIELANEALLSIEDNFQMKLDLLSEVNDSVLLESLAVWVNGFEGVESAATVGKGIYEIFI